MPNYPSVIDDFGTLPISASPRSNPSLAGNIDNLANAVVHIETELGLTPKGVYGSVAARLADTVTISTSQTLTGAKVFGAGLSVTTGGIQIAAGGLDVTGSALGSYSDEIRFPNTGAARTSALATYSTGAPVAYSDHRGTGNTGSWAWRNGSAAVNPRMTLSGAGLLGVTGGLDVSGTGSGTLTGGEVRFPTTTASAPTGLTSMATGSPGMVFQHYATSNTGSWAWYNGTAASVNRMTLSGAGLLTVTGGVVASGSDLKSTGTGGTPRLYLKSTDSALNAKTWDIVPIGNTLTFRTINDVENATNNWLTVTRSGTTMVNAAFGATVVAVATGGNLASYQDNDFHAWESDGAGGWRFANRWNNSSAIIRFYGDTGTVEMARMTKDVLLTSAQRITSTATSSVFGLVPGTGSYIVMYKPDGTSPWATFGAGEGSAIAGYMASGSSYLATLYTTTGATTPGVRVFSNASMYARGSDFRFGVNAFGDGGNATNFWFWSGTNDANVYVTAESQNYADVNIAHRTKGVGTHNFFDSTGVLQLATIGRGSAFVGAHNLFGQGVYSGTNAYLDVYASDGSSDVWLYAKGTVASGYTNMQLRGVRTAVWDEFNNKQAQVGTESDLFAMETSLSLRWVDEFGSPDFGRVRLTRGSNIRAGVLDDSYFLKVL